MSSATIRYRLLGANSAHFGLDKGLKLPGRILIDPEIDPEV